MQDTRQKIQRMNATNSTTDSIMIPELFNPEELLRITENPEKIGYLTERWYEKQTEILKWQKNAGMSILVKLPAEMSIGEVEQAFGILGKINSMKFMRSEGIEGPMYVAIEFHQWLCNEHVTVDCNDSCQDSCQHHMIRRDTRYECMRVLESISEQFPAYYSLPFRRYNSCIGIYETVNVPCTIYIEKPEDKANTIRLDGPTIGLLEEQVHPRVQRQIAEPPSLTRQRALSIPQTMDQRLAVLEMIIASQQKQLDELKKEVDSKASVSICSVSKNMFLIQDGEYIFVKNMQTSE